MKVLDVYGKRDLDLLTYNGRTICDLMNEFFLKFPITYRKNYDRNLETLELHRVDEMIDEFDSAQYYAVSNLIVFKSFAAIPHEMIHMATNDFDNKLFAFCRNGEYSLFENALIEGMTEYLSCIVKSGDPDAYFFECFAASMLSEIEGILECFFNPNYEKFISIFPNKKDIYSLLYALDFYHNNILAIDDGTSENDINRIEKSVKDTIDNLIDIELSFKKSAKEKKVYGDKFMDLISNSDLESIVSDVCPDYKDYAFHEVKKRILRRK